MKEYTRKMIVIIGVTIINIILILSVIISVVNTINSFKEKEKNGLLVSEQNQTANENMETEYITEEYEDSFSFLELIKSGYIGISEIIKIVLILISIILLSLGTYIYIKIK